MAQLNINQRQAGDVTILDLDGEVRIGDSSTALRSSIRNLVAGGNKKILLNLKGVRYSDSIAQAVREIEAKTDAEVVIVIRGRSGSYRQADYLCGAVFAFLGLLFVLFSPFDFHTYWVPFDVAVLFAVGAFVCSRTYLLRRLLTTKKFRAHAARQGAAAMFYEAGIANTHAENGMLIYVSLLE